MGPSHSNADIYFFIPNDFGTAYIWGRGGEGSSLIVSIIHPADVMSPRQKGFQKHPKDVDSLFGRLQIDF